MFNLEYLMWVRHEELLKEAENYRLISQARKHAPRRRYPYRKVLTWLGECLCKWGKLLQDRFGDIEADSLCQIVKSNI